MRDHGRIQVGGLTGIGNELGERSRPIGSIALGRIASRLPGMMSTCCLYWLDNFMRRPWLQTLIDFARKGDTIVVTRIDRLARSITDLAAIVRTLEHKGVALRATDQPIDTATAAGRCFLQMLGVFAEFETAIRKERQMEGIAKAKAEGVYKGRKPSIDA